MLKVSCIFNCFARSSREELGSMCSCSTAAPSCSLCLCIPFLVAWEFSIQQWCKEGQQGTVWSRTSSSPRLGTESSVLVLWTLTKSSRLRIWPLSKLGKGKESFLFKLLQFHVNSEHEHVFSHTFMPYCEAALSYLNKLAHTTISIREIQHTSMLLDLLQELIMFLRA